MPLFPSKTKITCIIILLITINYLEFGKSCTSISNKNTQLLIPTDIQYFRIGIQHTLIATAICMHQSSGTIPFNLIFSSLHAEFIIKQRKSQRDIHARSQQWTEDLYIDAKTCAPSKLPPLVDVPMNLSGAPEEKTNCFEFPGQEDSSTAKMVCHQRSFESNYTVHV